MLRQTLAAPPKQLLFEAGRPLKLYLYISGMKLSTSLKTRSL